MPSDYSFGFDNQQNVGPAGPKAAQHGGENKQQPEG